MKVIRVLTSLLAALGLAVAGCGGGAGPETRATGQPSTPPSTSAGPTGPPSPSASTPGPGTPAPGESLVAGRYQPLWPFSTQEEAEGWRRAHGEDGGRAWHLDAARTALAFTRDYLGFTEIDRAVKISEEGAHARVHVGYRSQEGDRPAVAAVVHLVRYGSGEDAPWEVVGTDDTSFTLTRPAYGAAVSSPLTVGGRISGVDESITVHVRRPGTDAPLGERCCVPAGGEKAPWSATVDFTATPGGTLTVVASTGGHVATVERFAVTGVSVTS
ncbi:hypothetical protein E1267_28645 [Nonomuraea longispora]|uniref:Bacterial spore germination immunoglobulin-like domain-containing protein n=1 Tax=Nonomuraea longispora TaxID=1848320 RepID=A0A4R4N254_9ACTN|nr:hypothetical protein [Nonomuraea longispora]TDC02781.1 hypothetical protein E1267_28645 [Nonomuraea longispora]